MARIFQYYLRAKGIRVPFSEIKSTNGFKSFLLGVLTGGITVSVHLAYYLITGKTPHNGAVSWPFYLFMGVFMPLFMWGFFYWMMEQSTESNMHYERMMRIGKMRVDAEKERQEKDMEERKKSKYGVRSTRRKNLGLK